MQVLNSSVARPWKLEQNTSGQASRQALRASRLWKLEQNNMTKKGPFFGPQNVRKSRRAKMGLPSTISMAGVYDSYCQEYLIPLAAHSDGHVLTVAIAMLLAILTGRSDLCIAHVFAAGKTRSLAVLFICL